MREHLIKIKKQSVFIIILGILTTIFGISQYNEAEKALMILDQAKLDEAVLK